MSHCNIYITQDCNMTKSFYRTTVFLSLLSILTSDGMFQVRSSWQIESATDAVYTVTINLNKN